MKTFKSIKDNGRERRIAKIQALHCSKAYRPARDERLTRESFNRQDPARLTRVLAVFGD